MPEVMSIEVDEEFDPRPPAQPFGMRGPDGNLNIGLVAGIVVAVILVVALIVVVANPFASDAKPVKTSNWKPVNPLENVKLIPAYAADEQIATDLQTALNAWANFYTNGDITSLNSSFDLAGRQYAQLLNGRPASEGFEAVKSAAELKSEISALSAKPVPAVIELSQMGNAGRKGNLYTVRAQIAWTQPGQEPTNYKWDVVMKRDGEKYLLSTVATTDQNAIGTLSFCDAAKLVEKLENDDVVTKELKAITSSKDSFVKYKEMVEIRKNTWEKLADATIVSDDKANVDEIVSAYEELLKNLKSSASLAEALKENIPDASVATENTVSVVKEECGLNIEKR